MVEHTCTSIPTKSFRTVNCSGIQLQYTRKNIFVDDIIILIQPIDRNIYYLYIDMSTTYLLLNIMQIKKKLFLNLNSFAYDQNKKKFS